MGSGYYDVLTSLFKRYECTFVKQGKGSHEIWNSPITNNNFTVPVTVASRHTANGILKQAGIPEKV